MMAIEFSALRHNCMEQTVSELRGESVGICVEVQMTIDGYYAEMDSDSAESGSTAGMAYAAPWIENYRYASWQTCKPHSTRLMGSGLESVSIATKGYACMLRFGLDPLHVGCMSVNPDRTRLMQAGGERESIAQPVAQDEPSPLYRLSTRRSQMCPGAWSTWNGTDWPVSSFCMSPGKQT